MTKLPGEQLSLLPIGRSNYINTEIQFLLTIYERWLRQWNTTLNHGLKGGDSIDCCAIITTKANSIVGKIHDRMPVIIPETAYDLWLDSWEEGNFFEHYLAPYPSSKMEVYPAAGSTMSGMRGRAVYKGLIDI